MSGYTLDEAIELYKSVGVRRGDFLFHWLYNIYDKTYLASIDDTYKEALTLDKTKLTMFDVLVDDLADNAKIRNKRLLDKAANIPWDGSKNYNHPYLNVTKRIWLDCISSIKRYPRYEEFKDIFFFDLEQVMNSMKYSYLVNTADFSNMIEDETYLNHGVMVILHCDMDLMCSPDFDYEELKKLRPILQCVQDVAHVGNMLNTYPKEILEMDLSSPIISLGLREGLIKRSDVVKDPEYVLASLESLVPYFKERMKNNLQKIKNHANDIKSVDIYDFYRRLEDVWKEFLKREQYWKTADIEENEYITKPIISVVPNYAVKWVRM